MLYVINGPQAGQRIPLRHGFTLGKNPGSDLSLAHDGFASGQHAQILMDQAGNCSLVDQGSTNGTFVNGVRITESRLSDGMAIRCGSTELRFLAQ
ncbi:MAG: FHA domain-containing protein [Kofleriaceae bacterium]|nr:FHA domain-containing protein [Kofleriaceae bacterium]MCB9571070.1 FHA domain-containing protein [Kofleriaceae bacterium]